MNELNEFLLLSGGRITCNTTGEILLLENNYFNVTAMTAPVPVASVGKKCFRLMVHEMCCSFRGFISVVGKTASLWAVVQ